MFLVVIMLRAGGVMTAGCTAKEEPVSAPAETEAPEADSTEPAPWEEAAAETL